MNDQSMTYCRETFTSPNLLNDRTEDFVKAQVAGRGLDDRTAKAYRLDLQHLSDSRRTAAGLSRHPLPRSGSSRKSENRNRIIQGRD